MNLIFKIEGVIFYLTFWYPPNEITFRIGLFYSSATLSGFLGGLISSGITNNMNWIANLQAWRWLFIIEGIPTVLVGILIFFILPDFPRSCSFLTNSEKTMLADEIDQHSKSTDQRFSYSDVIELMTTPSTYIFCVLKFFVVTAGYSFSFAYVFPK